MICRFCSLFFFWKFSVAAFNPSETFNEIKWIHIILHICSVPVFWMYSMTCCEGRDEGISKEDEEISLFQQFYCFLIHDACTYVQVECTLCVQVQAVHCMCKYRLCTVCASTECTLYVQVQSVHCMCMYRLCTVCASSINVQDLEHIHSSIKCSHW